MAKVQSQMTKGLEPHYNTTEGMKRAGMNSKAIRTIVAQLIPQLRRQGVPDTLGMDILEKYHLMGLNDALANIHFPIDNTAMQHARERLKFEELFYIQMQILRQMKRREQNEGYVMPIVGKHFHSFYRECLPFELTNAQKRVVREIQTDIKTGKQMNRLLQGDVGSGKTMVALLTALLAIDNGYQACIMAPTEILANQHYESICKIVALLTDICEQKRYGKKQNQLQRISRRHILHIRHIVVSFSVCRYIKTGFAPVLCCRFYLPQHFLNFLPLPQGQRSFLPTFGASR
jgi:RecG-like helicase